jgi:hypothetical protein
MLWWTDLGKTRLRKALEDLGEEVTTLSIKGLDGPFHLLRSELKKLVGMTPDDSPTINLLPYLDPYIMGYRERERYLKEEYRDLTFDRTGNAASAILLNGVITGVWDFEDKGEPRIKLFLFNQLPEDVLLTIEEKALRLGEFIADESVDLLVCDSMVPFSERTVGSFMSPLKGC